MRRRETDDVAVARAGRIIQTREEVGNARLVQAARQLVQPQQRRNLAGESEQPPRKVQEVERLDAEMVAGTEQRLCTSVPDGKGKVAEELLRTGLAPALV